MSADIQLPTHDVAYQNVFSGAYTRVFFNKMAAYGHVPQTEYQAQKMLESAGKLRLAREQDAVKRADARDDPYSLADRHLDMAMGGRPNQYRPHERQAAIKQAALELASDPTLYNSVLVLKAQEADEIYSELRARNGGG